MRVLRRSVQVSRFVIVERLLSIQPFLTPLALLTFFHFFQNLRARRPQRSLPYVAHARKLAVRLRFGCHLHTGIYRLNRFFLRSLCICVFCRSCTKRARCSRRRHICNAVQTCPFCLCVCLLGNIPRRKNMQINYENDAQLRP